MKSIFGSLFIAFLFATSFVSASATEIPKPVLSELELSLSAPSSSRILAHLEGRFNAQDWSTIATELLVLRHGPDLAEAAPVHVGAYDGPEGNREHANAERLGRYVGGLVLAVRRRADDPAEAAGILDGIISAMKAISPATEAHRPDLRQLVEDVRQDRNSLAQAFEILGYGDISASDVTGPINASIQAVLRNAQPH